MKCPKCLGRLSPIQIGSVEIDRCFVCEGLWFDPDELELVLNEYADELRKTGLDSDLFDGKEAAANYEQFDNMHGDCPRCKVKMFRARLGKVKADTCPQGHGLWLDGGEIAHLKKMKKRNFFEMAKYIFSAEGFLELKEKIHKKKASAKRKLASIKK